MQKPNTPPPAPSSRQVLPLLQSAPLFQGLSEADLATLAHECRLVRFPTCSEVLTLGRRTDALFVVVSGTLKVVLPRASGDLAVLNMVGPGEVLGEIHLVDGKGHSATVLTVEPVELLRIGREALTRARERAPILEGRLERLMAERLRLLTDRQAWMTTKGVAERVECLLLSFAERFVLPDAPETAAVPIPLRLAQKDLAALVGASSYRLGLALGAMEQKGLIRLEPHCRITVLNLTALRQCHDQIFSLR